MLRASVCLRRIGLGDANNLLYGEGSASGDVARGAGAGSNTGGYASDHRDVWRGEWEEIGAAGRVPKSHYQAECLAIGSNTARYPIAILNFCCRVC